MHGQWMHLCRLPWILLLQCQCIPQRHVNTLQRKLQKTGKTLRLYCGKCKSICKVLAEGRSIFIIPVTLNSRKQLPQRTRDLIHGLSPCLKKYDLAESGPEFKDQLHKIAMKYSSRISLFPSPWKNLYLRAFIHFWRSTVRLRFEAKPVVSKA